MSEEGEDRLPKRKIKRVMVLSSASGSDSDESVGATQTRKKRLRVVSDEEASDSSGSSVVLAGTRRGKALPRVRDAGSESDSSGCSAAPLLPHSASGFASDSSEGNSDKCSICLLRFRDQEVGTPQICEHIFCLDCITEWSKNVNTCPVDRLTFDSIVVRSCVGGRVLRTEPVVVSTRRPSTGSSIDILEIEDPTVCEICSGSNDEETMLLCDGCDLGYHMQCLSPPLTEVPIDQWFCPNCDDGSVSNMRDIGNEIYLSEVDDLLSLVDFDLNLGPRRVPLREPRNVRRSQRSRRSTGRPSTSAGSERTAVPGPSRAARATTGGAPARRRKTTTSRRPRRRNTTKTVIIEYEVQENGKFPITKRVKRKLRRRKRWTGVGRTAARRSHVRAAVRARLAALQRGGDVARDSVALSRPHLPGIPALSLLGDSHQLDYFSEEDASEGASTAVAPVRRTSALISAFRQARRKMISIPSPPHATSAPDLLSDILDSQTLLHSKKSIVSVSVDGQVNIKLQKTLPRITKKNEDVFNADKKIDLSKGEDTSRKAPSYPGGHSGQGRGWGGGYQGSYPRDSASHRPGNYNNYSDDYPGRQGANNYSQNDNNGRRDEFESYGNFQRRPSQYSPYDDSLYDRNRRPNPSEINNQNRTQMGNQRPEPGRNSLGPSWQPYGGGRQDAHQPPNRHSFGGLENPLDMRMGQVAPQGAPNNPADSYRHDKPPAQLPTAFRPLTEPPTFDFGKVPEIEKSEDERSDSGLVIDTEKYDPTEPTHDEDSGDERRRRKPLSPPPPPPLLSSFDTPSLHVPPAALHVPPTVLHVPPTVLHVPPTILPVPPTAPHVPPSALHVPRGVLDSAVRQTLSEHLGLLGPVASQHDSDDESDGDCPNFSIYSATSVHIAAGSSLPLDPRPPAQPSPHEDNLEDLVQEDDDVPVEPSVSSSEDRMTEAAPQLNDTTPSKSSTSEAVQQKVDEVYKEKVSKRCPITTNTRNPIKIKLNTPSLMKRVSLYDEEDVGIDLEPEPEPAVEKIELTPGLVEENEPSEALRSPQTPLLDDNDCGSPTPDAMDSVNADEKLDTSAHSDTKSTPSRQTDQKEDEEEDDKDLEKYKLDEPDDVSGDELADQSKLASVEKMTESISETEDERSYTPCLDENKDASPDHDADKDHGIEGLDTELISEEEANDIFSEDELRASPAPPVLPLALTPDKRKNKPDDKESKKKKKKDSKKDVKDKKTKTKKSDVTFKKLSKSGKERNYREREKEEKEKRRRDSSEGERDRRRRKGAEKRKDLERYDVRTVVGDKRKGKKDPFGRDVSPRRSPSPPARTRRSLSRQRKSLSRPRGSPPARTRRSVSRTRRSISRAKRSISRAMRSISRAKRVKSRSTSRPKRSPSPPARGRRSASPPARRSAPPAGARRRRSSSSPPPPPPPPAPARRRRRSPERSRKRRRDTQHKQKAPKKKKRESPRRKSPKRKKAKRRSSSRSASPGVRAWSPASLESRLPSPRTPPPPPRRHKRAPPPASKEVFTSGDNILVSVNFGSAPPPAGPRRRRRRAPPPRAAPAAALPAGAKPVAIIDLERSPFRELTPSPKNVIVLSDSEHGEEPEGPGAEAPAVERGAVGPKTPPEPAQGSETGAGGGAPEPPAPSPDAYDPFEPTRSPSPSPSPSPPPAAEAAPPSPPRVSMTLEAAQKTNMSADEVLDRRPISPIEKVMALLQSTRDESPEPPPSVEGAPTNGVLPPGPPAAPRPPAPAAAPRPLAPGPPRVVLPEPSRPLPPKLFLAKPSPIKSNPVKPMQATKISKLPLPPLRRDTGGSDLGGDSPYSPGSSDFADLFEPRPAPGGKRDMFDSLFGAKPNKRKDKNAKGSKLSKKKGNKTQVGVKVDEDNLKILDELPSSAVEMQVKSKFLKKLNRQERVVEEVKLVLKPHYNKKHVTKEEYKDILRRTVPKICHNKTGEINPTKIQALVEAYVKKFRKKHKLGIV